MANHEAIFGAGRGLAADKWQGKITSLNTMTWHLSPDA
jgi:hypothetical protein